MKNKWGLLAFLCGTFFVYTIDRALLGLLAIPIQEETGISDLQFGILNSAVFWTYAAIVPFAGLAGDRFDRRKVIGAALVAWSLMSVIAGFAQGFWSIFLLVSVAITVPQTLYGPAANALIASRHVETRTVALSFHQAAFYIGWFASGSAAALALSFLGTWRAAYWIFGALGLLMGAWFLVFQSGGSSGSDAGGGCVRKVSFRESLKAFFCCPSALLAASGYVAIVFVGFGYSAWGPKFVAQKFSLSPSLAGTGVMFWHFAAALAAIVAAGFVTDRAVRRWPRFRLAMQSAALLAAAPMLSIFGLGSSLSAVWFAAAAYGFMRGLFEANAFTSIFDVVSSRHRAGAVGFLNVIAGLTGSLAPMILGWLSQTKGLRGLETGFAAMGAVLAVAALLLCASAIFTFKKDRITETGNV
jgi:MFS family permease